MIATGDALHGWVPFTGDCYPYDWIKTLDAAEKLDFDQAIGGHGDIIPGKEKFEMWKQYFTDRMSATAEAYAQGATLEEAQKQMSALLAPKYASKFGERFSDSVVGNITKAYLVTAQR